MSKHSKKTHHASKLSRIASVGALVGAITFGSALVGSSAAIAAPDSAWDRLAQCESGGNWKINTGNGYYGGLQFNPRTWRAFGGTGMPHQASRSEQIAVAERTLAVQGWNAWPSCSRKMGLRGHRPATEVSKAPPVTHNAIPAVFTGKTYTVKRGDTLAKIAPHNWQDVANRNNIKNPNLIFPGQVITL